VLYFFRRGKERRVCETRLRQDGPGYELVISDDGTSRTEAFTQLAAMLSREHELLQAWRAQGWRDADAPEHRKGDGRHP